MVMDLNRNPRTLILWHGAKSSSVSSSVARFRNLAHSRGFDHRSRGVRVVGTKSRCSPDVISEFKGSSCYIINHPLRYELYVYCINTAEFNYANICEDASQQLFNSKATPYKYMAMWSVGWSLYLSAVHLCIMYRIN